MSAISDRPAPHLSFRPRVPLPAVPPVVAGADVPALQRLGYMVLLVLLFLVYSRVFDIALYYLHIPGIAIRALALLLLLSGAFLTPFRSPLGRYVLGFTACMVVSIPFSVWRSASLRILTDGWLTCVILFVGIAGLVTTLKQCRTAIYAIASAVLVLALLSFKVGHLVGGRLTWANAGKFANPNDLAQALLIGMPLWWLIAKRSRSAVGKIFAAGVMLLIMRMIAKTGSRGAVVAIVVVAFVLFLRSDMADKIKIAAVMAVAICVAMLTLSHSVKARLTTLVEHDEDAVDEQYRDDAAVVDSAVSSTSQRKKLLRRSIILTLRHPLFGVGPGMFMVAEDTLARAEGERRGAWLQTHNSYTQVSSEIGIPALVFYLAILIYSLRHTRRVYNSTRGKPEFAEICEMAICLNFVVICFMITATFASVAYSNFVPVLAGLTCAFLRITAPEVERARAQAAQQRTNFAVRPPQPRSPVTA